MERVAKLIKEDRFREAYVRLWVLARESKRLNRWEQDHDEQRKQSFPLDLIKVKNMCGQHDCDANELVRMPLVLICALDELLEAESDIPRQCKRTYKVNGQEYWLLPASLENTCSLNKQIINRKRWFCHHLIVAKQTATLHQVQLHVCQYREAEIFHALVESKAAVRIWVGHFDDCADVTWDQQSNTANNWRTEAILQPDQRWLSLEAQLLEAKQAAAHMLVFPEFSLDLPLRKKLSAWLRRNAWDDLIFLVPGSFHEQLACGDFYNTAPLVCAASDVLFTHQKLKLFGDEVRGGERTQIGDVLHVVMTPLGLLTVVICKDFMDADPTIASLLQEVAVNWVLVPSFGDAKTLRAHKTRAHALANIAPGANSAVANTANSALKEENVALTPIPGFGHRCNEKEPVAIGLRGGLVEFPFRLKNAS